MSTDMTMHTFARKLFPIALSVAVASYVYLYVTPSGK